MIEFYESLGGLDGAFGISGLGVADDLGQKQHRDALQRPMQVIKAWRRAEQTSALDLARASACCRRERLCAPRSARAASIGGVQYGRRRNGEPIDPAQHRKGQRRHTHAYKHPKGTLVAEFNNASSGKEALEFARELSCYKLIGFDKKVDAKVLAPLSRLTMAHGRCSL
jgi:hypothetical protein